MPTEPDDHLPRPARVSAVELALGAGWAVVLSVAYYTRFWFDDCRGGFFDDYFYYVVPAANYVEHGLASFDGVTPTNGYQPLWFWMTCVLVALAGTGFAFFFTATLLMIAFNLTAFVFCLRLCRRLSGRPLVALAATLYFCAVPLAFISAGGMEVSAAVACLFFFVWHLYTRPLGEQSPWQWGLSGLIAATTVLARLDSIVIMFAIAACLLIAHPGSRPDGRRLCSLLLGATPLFVYLLFNVWRYGTFLPISGRAKQSFAGVLPSFEHKWAFWGLEDSGPLALGLLYPFYICTLCFL